MDNIASGPMAVPTILRGKMGQRAFLNGPELVRSVREKGSKQKHEPHKWNNVHLSTTMTIENEKLAPGGRNVYCLAIANIDAVTQDMKLLSKFVREKLLFTLIHDLKNDKDGMLDEEKEAAGSFINLYTK